MRGMSMIEQPSDHEVVFWRLLDAPRELVWSVWTEPRHLQHWFGPEGFTTVTHEFAFVPGGVWRFNMYGPHGADFPNRIVFREIEPPSRLVYENGWELPGAELTFTVVVTLGSEGDRTRLTLRFTFRDAEALKVAVERYGVRDGGTQALDRMAAYLSTPGSSMDGRPTAIP